ncbi:MAG: HAD family phosphatase [Trueperaceae bacterium]
MTGGRFLEAYDAILFDMDGTLVDTEELWFEAGQVVAARYGAVLPDSASVALHGLDVVAFAGRLRSDYGLQAGAQEFSAALLEDVLERLAGANCRPGAKGLVEGAAASGKKLGLVSNSSHQVIEATLAPFEWARELERRFSVDEVARGKPAPDLYLHAAACLGIEPWRCVVVEDSVAGVTSAVSAGATCVAVTFADKASRFAGLTDLVVPSLIEAAEALLED